MFWGIGESSKNKEAAIVFAKMLRQEQEVNYEDGVKTEAERYLSDEQFSMARELSETGHCYHANRLTSWIAQYNYGFWDRLGVQNLPIATLLDQYEPYINSAINSMNK